MVILRLSIKVNMKTNVGYLRTGIRLFRERIRPQPEPATLVDGAK
jgi:hypothetical protein